MARDGLRGGRQRARRGDRAAPRRQAHSDLPPRRDESLTGGSEPVLGRVELAGAALHIAPDGTARLGPRGPGIGFRPPLVAAGPTGFAPVDWSAPEFGIVHGEAESVRTGPGLRWLVRHQVVEDAWQVRTVLTAAPGTAPGSAGLEVDAGDAAAWVWAAGSAALVVLADDPVRPVALRLRRGRLEPPDPKGRRQGAYEWFDGGADLARPVVLELAGTRCRSWAEAHSLLPAWLPELALTDGDELRLALPDDCVTGPGAETSGEGDHVVRGRGRVRVRVAGVSGDVALEVDFAPAIEGQLRLAADRFSARSGQRVSPRGDTDALAAAAIVLAASGRTGTDLFDLVCGELVERRDDTGLRTVALAHAAVALPEPVIGRALAQAVAAVCGPTARTVVKAVLRAALWSPEVTDRVLRAAPRDPDPAEAPASIAARLGGGLPGRPARYDPVVAARDAACLAGADEALDPRQWPYPAPTIVEHAGRRLLATEAGDERVLAWLVVGAAAGGQAP